MHGVMDVEGFLVGSPPPSRSRCGMHESGVPVPTPPAWVLSSHGEEPMAMEMSERAPRIMVVDDDRTVADVVMRYLEREGYEVTATGDGSVAVELAEAPHTPPDLVILDLMLPGLD